MKNEDNETSLTEEEIAAFKKESKEKAKQEQKIKAMTQKEMQQQFNMFKKRFKVRSKGELIAIIWEQGMEFKRLQDMAKELYEENKALKESQDA